MKMAALEDTRLCGTIRGALVCLLQGGGPAGYVAAKHKMEHWKMLRGFCLCVHTSCILAVGHACVRVDTHGTRQVERLLDECI